MYFANAFLFSLLIAFWNDFLKKKKKRFIFLGRETRTRAEEGQRGRLSGRLPRWVGLDVGLGLMVWAKIKNLIQSLSPQPVSHPGTPKMSFDVQVIFYRNQIS